MYVTQGRGLRGNFLLARARYRERGASDFPLPLEHLLRELIFHQYQTLFFKSRVAVYRLHIFLGSMYWWVENSPSPRC